MIHKSEYPLSRKENKMYKNTEEKIKGSKRDSLKIASVLFIILMFVLAIAYFAGYIDNVE